MRVPSGFVWTCSPPRSPLDDLPVLVLLALRAVEVGRDDRAVLVRLRARAVERDLDDVPFKFS